MVQKGGATNALEDRQTALEWSIKVERKISKAIFFTGAVLRGREGKVKAFLRGREGKGKEDKKFNEGHFCQFTHKFS